MSFTSPVSLPLVSKRVLIVGPQFIIAPKLAASIQGAGAQILGPFTDEKGAMACLRSDDDIDLAVIEITGLGDCTAADELARALRWQGVPFVVLTSYPRGALLGGLRSGFYLAKPARGGTAPLLLASLASATAKAAAEWAGDKRGQRLYGPAQHQP